MVDNGFLPMAKEDVSMIMEKLMEHDIAIADIRISLKRLDEKLDTLDTRIVREFKMITEQLVTDFRGGMNDRFEGHERRILLIEHHLQLSA